MGLHAFGDCSVVLIVCPPSPCSINPPFSHHFEFLNLFQIHLPWEQSSDPLAKVTPPLQFDFGSDIYYIARFWAVVGGALFSTILFYSSYVFLGNRDLVTYDIMWLA